MKTMEQIDAWYDGEINKAMLKGKIELASTVTRAKFGAESLTPQIGASTPTVKRAAT